MNDSFKRSRVATPEHEKAPGKLADSPGAEINNHGIDSETIASACQIKIQRLREQAHALGIRLIPIELDGVLCWMVSHWGYSRTLTNPNDVQDFLNSIEGGK